MRLEDLQAELRPRTAFEAMDLGVALLRRSWGAVAQAWLVVVAPVWLATFGLLGSHPMAAILITWWVRPVFDRVVLHVLSRSLFGATPTLRDTLMACPRLLTRRLPQALIVERLRPHRAVDEPITELEALRGRALARRRRELHRGVLGSAATLQLLSFVFELCVLGGLLVFVFLFVPNSPIYGELLWQELSSLSVPTWFHWVLPVALFVAHSLVEPLYVAAGFGLYLNRRTLLEGWDIEIRFRQIAARLARAAVASVLVFALAPGARAFSGEARLAPRCPATLSAWADHARAHSVQTSRAAAPDPADTIAEVLADLDFDRTEHRTRWELRHKAPKLLPKGDAPQAQPVDIGLPIALTVTALLWPGLFIGLTLLAARLLARRGKGAPPVRQIEIPEIRTGRVASRAAPHNPVEVARQLWANGDATGAIGVLYRGAVEDMVRRGLPIDPGTTEDECLGVVRRMVEGEERNYFANLTDCWLRLAYAHQRLDGDRATMLLTRWPSYYRGAR